MWVISSTEPGTFKYVMLGFCYLASNVMQCSIRIADGQDPYWFDKFNVGIDNRVCLTVC